MRRHNRLSAIATGFAGAALLVAPLFMWGQNQALPTGDKLAPAPQKTEKPTDKSDDADAVFSSETRLVPLAVTVTDKTGHLVTNLTLGAFTVLENGVPQQIKLFKREDVPISLGLLIDNSGSMREKRQAVESSALTLVRDSNPQDEAFIVNFNDEPFLDAEFTSDIKMLEQGLTKIDSRGGTAMREAIRVSIDHLQQKGKHDKKVLLVVTDGNDNASVVSLPEIVRQAQEHDVIIYAIGLLSEEERKEAAKAKRALNLLVEGTGGLVFYPKDVTEVDKIAHEVAHDIRNQYTIAYSPSNQALDGTFRTIKVTVKGGAAARTRSGYYANKPAAKRAP